MKKVIEGVMYDTEKAMEIASHSEGYIGDFRRYEESLYRTAKGRWFLAGEGGPMTKYAKHRHDHTTGGDDIIPLTSQEARDWLANRDEIEALKEYFSHDLEEA